MSMQLSACSWDHRNKERASLADLVGAVETDKNKALRRALLPESDRHACTEATFKRGGKRVLVQRKAGARSRVTSDCCFAIREPGPSIRELALFSVARNDDVPCLFLVFELVNRALPGMLEFFLRNCVARSEFAL